MIYCVEDEGSIRDLMLYTLNMAGFEAQGFASSEPFWDAMKKERPELILLDIMLPGEDGIAVLRRLRSSPVTADIPVIMATAKGSEYDRVVGLDLGADDYLSKPFRHDGDGLPHQGGAAQGKPQIRRTGGAVAGRYIARPDETRRVIWRP